MHSAVVYTLKALLALREALKDEIEKERNAVARLKEKLSRVQGDDNSSDESVSPNRHLLQTRAYCDVWRPFIP